MWDAARVFAGIVGAQCGEQQRNELEWLTVLSRVNLDELPWPVMWFKFFKK